MPDNMPIVPQSSGDLLVGEGSRDSLQWVSKPYNSFGAFTQLTRIHCIGDSNTVGAVNGTVGAWRMPMYNQLRRWRDDFDLVGSVAMGNANSPEFLSTFGLWYHTGIAGQTLVAEAPLFAAQNALAPTDIILDMLGTNDIIVGGFTANQMMAARRTLVDAYRAASPEAKIVMVMPPPFVAGTTVGGNLAAWNAIRAEYQAQLEKFAQDNPKLYFVDATRGLGNGDFITDGVHLTNTGQGKLGVNLAAYLDGVILGPRRNGVISQPSMRERAPAFSLSVPAAANRLVSNPDATFGPSASSFALAIDYYTPVLSGAAYTNVFSYGATGDVPNYFQIVQQAGRLDVFWQSAAGNGEFVGQPQTRAVQAAKWHRIVLIAFLNGANSTLGLYVNGRLVALKDGIAAWGAFVAKSIALGLSSDYLGEAGTFYSRLQIYKGSVVPRPGTMAALRGVERDYYNGAAMFPGGMVASYTLDNTLNGEISGSAALVLAGAVFQGAYAPSGGGTTPQRPWEMPQYL